jgi:cytochrome c551/c552
LKARLVISNLRQHYIHTITLDGIRDKENYFNLVHPTAYYTLNNIPEGTKLSISDVSTKNSAKNPTAPVKAAPVKGKPLKTAALPAKVLTYDDVKPLLAKNTCSACHNPDAKQVGPAFKDVAKRGYTVAQIVALIKNPKPEHWPDYSTPMPPMPQVSNPDAVKIATWIRSLK